MYDPIPLKLITRGEEEVQAEVEVEEEVKEGVDVVSPEVPSPSSSKPLLLCFILFSLFNVIVVIILQPRLADAQWKVSRLWGIYTD
jgi:hypothetical protein